MSYLRIKKSRDRKIKTGLILLGCFLFILLAYTTIVSSLGATARGIGRPLWWFEDRIGNGFSSIAVTWKSKANLSEENARLREDLLQAELRAFDRDVLAIENAALKEAFGRKPEGVFVLAKILVRPPRSLYDTLVLDIGENDGVSPGDEVYAFGSILLGRIQSVDKNSSLATLYSTAGEHFLARHATTGVDLDLVGRGGGSFEVTVARDLVLLPGDEIVSFALTPSVVATVGEVISDPRDPYQKVLLLSPANIQALSFVEIKKATSL